MNLSWSAMSRCACEPRRRAHRCVSLALVAVVVLSGCSIGGSDDVAPTATVPAVSGPTTGVSSGVAAPRLVGELADRIDAAWRAVGSYRVTTVQGTGDLALIPLPAPPVSGALPEAGATYQSAIDEVVLPDQRHYLEISGGGVSEFTAAGGRVYARGRFTQLAIRPDIDAATWVNLDPSFISPDSSIGQFLSGFIGPEAAAFRSPLADLQPDTRERALTPIDPIVVGDRQCAAYRWTETGQTGEAMTRTVSIDAAGLPCSLEFTAGDYSSRVVWDVYNGIAPITAPEGAVTVGETLEMGAGPASPAAGTDGPPATPVAPGEPSDPLATPVAVDPVATSAGG